MTSLGVCDDVLVAASNVVKGVIFALRLSNRGLLLRGRARFSGSELELSASSLTGGEVTRAARERDLVIGPKYPSLEGVSEGVGDGDMTLGVAGIG